MSDDFGYRVWTGSDKRCGPTVPGDVPILEVTHNWGLVYARTEHGWYWYREETDEWMKVSPKVL